MTDELASAISDLASTLNTGTAPGEPPAPFIPRFMTGTISAVSSTKCNVVFPATPGGAPGQVVEIDNLSYLLSGRQPVVNDIALILQTAHQRIVVGVISGAAAYPYQSGITKVATAVADGTKTFLEIAGIPNIFTSLLVKHSLSSTASGNSDGARMWFNGDQGADYDWSELVVNGSSVSGGRFTSQNNLGVGEMPTQAPYWSVAETIIEQYNVADNWKHMRNKSGSILNGTGPWTFDESGYWKNTTADLDRIAIGSSLGQNLRAGSRMTIYGYL